jgi:hypothetical protein
MYVHTNTHQYTLRTHYAHHTTLFYTTHTLHYTHTILHYTHTTLHTHYTTHTTHAHLGSIEMPHVNLALAEHIFPTGRSGESA